MPWFDLLLSHAGAKAGQPFNDLSLPGELLDLTPFNLVETASGLAPIDMEWRLDRAIPLGWVVTRAVVHSLCGTPGFEREPIAIANVVEALCTERGLTVHRHDIDGWLEREAELQKAEALLLASQSGFPSGHIDHKFRRHVARAIDLIDRAAAQIEQAKNVVDSAIED